MSHLSDHDSPYYFQNSPLNRDLSGHCYRRLSLHRHHRHHQNTLLSLLFPPLAYRRSLTQLGLPFHHCPYFPDSILYLHPLSKSDFQAVHLARDPDRNRGRTYQREEEGEAVGTVGEEGVGVAGHDSVHRNAAASRGANVAAVCDGYWGYVAVVVEEVAGGDVEG